MRLVMCVGSSNDIGGEIIKVDWLNSQQHH